MTSNRAAIVGMTDYEYTVALRELGRAWTGERSLDQTVEAIHCRGFGGYRQGQSWAYFWHPTH